MAVPSSGAISMLGVAKERWNNTISIDGYTSGTTPTSPISMKDIMIGGNAGGSGVSYCPPKNNRWFQDPFYVERPYNPDYDQPDNSDFDDTPYALSEFRGYQHNRELGCMKINFNTACAPATATLSASAAGQSFRFDFVLDYTPPGSGAIIYMEIDQTWAGLSTSSDTTGGSGSQTISFTATVGTTTRYLNVATNTGSARSLNFDVYISGSCYSTANLLHDYVVSQAAGSGGGGGTGGPGPAPGGGSE